LVFSLGFQIGAEWEFSVVVKYLPNMNKAVDLILRTTEIGAGVAIKDIWMTNHRTLGKLHTLLEP
jgi:hypothetical protein